MESYSDSYKDAGVDLTAGYKAVELIKKHVAATKTQGVISDIGGFGGLFAPDLQGISNPVLVSGTDGVGTKIIIAFMMDKHDTVGIDCVAMCANDVACSGARPLFFLDYLAVGKNIPEKVATIVGGIAQGCIQAGCALIGGETAEMPGLYPADEYDLAGFCVGLADKADIIDCSSIHAGDVIIGVSSSGVHSNGFSLIRKAFNVSRERLSFYLDDCGKTLGEELLTPTRIYVKPVLELMKKVKVKGISHITGGGFYENIPRVIGTGLQAVIEKSNIPQKPIFSLIQNQGISEREMYNTFNMGLGLCIVVEQTQADEAVRSLIQSGEEATIVGEVQLGEQGVVLC
ncbi:MAG: phosphoribosylformylglycinamidine cyclo-ligase [Acutalibacteraceae bacterium]|jgi:phosphoribosylformylglycinamidine cyclo-ligase